MAQAGVDRKVIREYTGHATDSMHDRYHILRNEQVVSANWWRSLSRRNREQIEGLACIGNPYYTEFSYAPSRSLVPWKITEIVD